MRKSRLYAFFSLLLLSILLVLSFIVQAQADSTWSIQTLDDNGSITRGTSLALDSKNNPHLCYTAYEDGYYRNPRYLMYASWNGSAWSIQNVTYDGRVGNSGLAVDSNNNPHIVYTDWRLIYASWTGEDWSLQIISSEEALGFLVLDSVDNPNIVYSGANGALKYAVLKDSNWSIQTVDTQEGLESTPSLALDSNDYPHILYGYSTGNGNTTVKYAAWNGSSWNFQTVISNSDISFGNIALDSRCYPHFTYYTNGLLTYASWNGADWNTQIVDSTTGEGGPGFLIFDFINNPHISYFKRERYGDEFVMYAEWTGTSWGIQTVDSSSLIRLGSMVLDSSGSPHISYLAFLQNHIGSVMYAKGTPILSLTQIFGIALLVFLLLAIAIAVIVKRMVKKN
jgi:hypothetical protein